MNDVKLDLKRMLGFKIIADGSVSKLSSPKIGDKSCPAIEADTAFGAVATTASLQANIGAKVS